MKKYSISISRENYKEKPSSNEISKMKFHEEKLELVLFAELIRNGYSYTNNFNTINKQFSIKEKTISNFKDTQLVSIDIDNGNKPFKQFIQNLTYTPTISYTSPSYNEVEEKFKFRLIYTFNSPITTIQQYQGIYYSIVSQIEKDNEFTNSDNCASSVAQYYNGSYHCQMMNDFQRTYDIDDFELVELPQSKKANTTPTTTATNKGDIELNLDTDFLNDMNSLLPTDFLEKYKVQYTYFTHSPITFENGYATTDGGDYLEIYRQYCWNSAEMTNGDSKYTTITKKIKDGEGRRRKLTLAAMIRRKILPTITGEELIFNLIYDRTYYYDNSDKVLNNRELLRIAKYVLSLEEINFKSNGKKFFVDKEYWAKQGVSPKQAKQIIQKKIAMDNIAQHYNSELSVRENLEILHSQGFKVSRATIYNYLQSLKITTKIDIAEWYDTNLSLKENLQIANDSGIKVSRRTLYNWVKKNNINPSPKKVNNVKKEKKGKTTKASTTTTKKVEDNSKQEINSNIVNTNSIHIPNNISNGNSLVTEVFRRMQK